VSQRRRCRQPNRGRRELRCAGLRVVSADTLLDRAAPGCRPASLLCQAQARLRAPRPPTPPTTHPPTTTLATALPHPHRSCSYLEMMRELEQQIEGQGFTDIAMVSRQHLPPRPLAQPNIAAPGLLINSSTAAKLAAPSRAHCHPLARTATHAERLHPTPLPPPSARSAATQACGSGGTTAGIALGCHLSGLGLRVHAYGVCDDPNYFYDFCDGLLEGMGATPAAVGASAADMFRCGAQRPAGPRREGERAGSPQVGGVCGWRGRPVCPPGILRSVC
jgi:hypothetical protein